jgi:antiviral helicase SKI2
MSLERAPGPNKSFVRGKSGYIPFWPGGLDDVVVDSKDENNQNKTSKGMRTVPPGFTRGLHFAGEEDEDDTLIALTEKSGLSRKEETEEVSLVYPTSSSHLLNTYELARSELLK